jgi:hypothetical protein
MRKLEFKTHKDTFMASDPIAVRKKSMGKIGVWFLGLAAFGFVLALLVPG